MIGSSRRLHGNGDISRLVLGFLSRRDICNLAYDVVQKW